MKDYKPEILSFIKFVIKEVDIVTSFSLCMSTDRSKFKTLAHYDPVEKSVAVYVKNRALPDILRSIAHELVHHKQNETGELNSGEPIPDIGGKIEDDANAIAGQLIKKYGKFVRPDIFDL